MRVPRDTLAAMLAAPGAAGVGVRLPAGQWPPPPPGCSEDVFQQHVIALARANGWRVAHFRTVRVKRRSGKAYYATPVQADGAGFPDLLMVRPAVPARLVVAELKVGDNTTTREQREWIYAFMMANVSTFVWVPADWPQIAAVLSGEAP